MQGLLNASAQAGPNITVSIWLWHHDHDTSNSKVESACMIEMLNGSLASWSPHMNSRSSKSVGLWVERLEWSSCFGE